MQDYLFIASFFVICYLQAHAASAVLNFSENCTPDILTPYLDGVVSKLLVLLQVMLLKIMCVRVCMCIYKHPIHDVKLYLITCF